MQASGHAIVNVLLGQRFAVGVVPSVLYNPTIKFVPTEVDFALGLNGQVYVSQHVSFLAEWVVSPTHPAVDSADLAARQRVLRTRVGDGGALLPGAAH